MDGWMDGSILGRFVPPSQRKREGDHREGTTKERRAHGTSKRSREDHEEEPRGECFEDIPGKRTKKTFKKAGFAGTTCQLDLDCREQLVVVHYGRKLDAGHQFVCPSKFEFL